MCACVIIIRVPVSASVYFYAVLVSVTWGHLHTTVDKLPDTMQQISYRESVHIQICRCIDTYQTLKGQATLLFVHVRCVL